MREAIQIVLALMTFYVPVFVVLRSKRTGTFACIAVLMISGIVCFVVFAFLMVFVDSIFGGRHF
jgi:hypothetical protein